MPRRPNISHDADAPRSDYPQGHVFVSYSSVDARGFVMALAAEFERREGPTLWIDRPRIRGVHDWDHEIDTAIHECAALLFVVSKDSVLRQSVCGLEWKRALQLWKPVILLRLHGDVEFPLDFVRRQYIDFAAAFDRDRKRPKPTAFAATVPQVLDELRWLGTPEARLELLGQQLAAAEFSLVHAPREEWQRRREEIDALRREIDRQRKSIDDLEGLRERTRRRIARQVECDRRGIASQRRARGGPKVPFPPPLDPPAYFQDRSAEAALVRRFLRNEATRVLILGGRGGLGKTAIACRVLRTLESPSSAGDRIAGVIHLCAVGTHRVTVPDLFAGIRACLPPKAVRATETLFRDPRIATGARMTALLEHVGATRIVALLDNFETVLDLETHALRTQAPDLDEALRAVLEAPAHRLKIIATTQFPPTDLQRFHAERQEYVQLDDGLPSPYAERILRAMDGDGSLGLRHAPRQLLTEAREQSMGNPRALEVMVGLLRARHDLTLADLLADTKGLSHDVTEVLVGRLFRSLDPMGQLVMQALAIFGRPVSRAAVDFLLEPYAPGIDAQPILARLVNMSAVTCERGTSRFSLHSIDRSYAAERIPAEAPASAGAAIEAIARVPLLRRAATYFRQIRPPAERWVSADALEPQLAEFDLLCSAGDHNAAARVLLEIDQDYLSRWGMNRHVALLHAQLRGWLTDGALRLENAHHGGRAHFLMGDYRTATEWFEDAVRLARSSGGVKRAAVLADLGHCRLALGAFDRARRSGSDALRLARASTDDGKRARLTARHVLAFVASAVGAMEAAVAHARYALTLARELRDRREESMQLGYLGLFASYVGDLGEAVQLDRRALELAQEIGARREEAFHWGFLAAAYAQSGRYADSLDAAARSNAIEREITQSATGSWCHQWSAIAHCLSGDLAQAKAAADAGGDFDEPLNNPNVQVLRGIVALRLGDEPTAREAFERAVAQSRALVRSCAKNWEALDAEATGLAGLFLADGGTGPRRREAVRAFGRARAITRAEGIVRRVAMHFEMLAPLDAAGTLEPIRAAATGSRPVSPRAPRPGR